MVSAIATSCDASDNPVTVPQAPESTIPGVPAVVSTNVAAMPSPAPATAPVVATPASPGMPSAALVVGDRWYSCIARNVGDEHDNANPRILVKQGTPHGSFLFCNHDRCVSSGRKFRWCAVCQVPAGTRNFMKRHSHGLITSARYSHEDYVYDEQQKMTKLQQKRKSPSETTSHPNETDSVTSKMPRSRVDRSNSERDGASHAAVALRQPSASIGTHVSATGEVDDSQSDANGESESQTKRAKNDRSFYEC